jgi:hypothetical protein
LIGSGCSHGDRIDHSGFLSDGPPYRSSRPDTDQRVFLHELAIGLSRRSPMRSVEPAIYSPIIFFTVSEAISVMIFTAMS